MKPTIVLALAALSLTIAACDKPEPPKPIPASKEDAESCFRRDDFTCAALNYYGYLQKFPTETNTRAIYAIALTRSGQHAIAIPQYERVLKEGAGTYDLFASYAVSLDAVGRADDAITWNRKTLELVPNLVDVRGTLAQQLVKKGQYDEAIKLLEDFDTELRRKGHSAYFTGQIIAIKDAKKAAE